MTCRPTEWNPPLRQRVATGLPDPGVGREGPSFFRLPRFSRDTAQAVSEENVKTVLDADAAFNGGDLDAWLEQWAADDIDYRAIEGAPDDPGPIRGKNALRAYVQDWIGTFDDFRSDSVDLIDAGEDRVIVVTRSAAVPSSAASRRI
jgi:ketosteroid isomerase-like protein